MVCFRGSWPAALALLGPLAALTAWVGWGAVARTHGPRVATAAAAVPARPASPLPGWPAPASDLARDRLEERVDGAAETLRGQGCRRLLYWRLSDPPSDLEVLVFATADGAGAALAADAGGERTPGPGDEAQLGGQWAYLRRGSVYVRLLLDPEAAAGAATRDALRQRAEEVDAALRRGGEL